eukprot:256355-Chlamydomonas_euryale.AAC.7
MQCLQLCAKIRQTDPHVRDVRSCCPAAAPRGAHRRGHTPVPLTLRLEVARVPPGRAAVVDDAWPLHAAPPPAPRRPPPRAALREALPFRQDGDLSCLSLSPLATPHSHLCSPTPHGAACSHAACHSRPLGPRSRPTR